ncbi:MAG TPA: hypothetical protein VF792_06135 [Ktedonobacterales bacterium]
MRSKKRSARLFRRWSVFSLLPALALIGLLTGCSASGSSKGIDFQLGLQGSTADNPAAAPKIASNGPDNEYAFVYDNQVWIHPKGGSAAVQITHLTLSNGATLVWGPLVWSPSGNMLAFSLVQNMSTDQPTRAAGTIYYTNLSTCLSASKNPSCPTYHTQASGSVYGHAYGWLGDDWLISGSGGGLMAYDVSDPNGRRTWQIRTTDSEQQDYACSQPRAYGDVQVDGSLLYYTCEDLSNVTAANVIGSASLNEVDMSSLVSAFSADKTTRDDKIASILMGGLGGSHVTSLGNVYVDTQGNVVAGAWQISGTTAVFEQIGAVDAQHGTAARTLCSSAMTSGDTCDSTPIPAVTSQTLAAHPQISVGPNGVIAYQGDALYLSGQKDSIPVSSPYLPGWISGGSVVATNVTSTTTDASGVTRTTANLVVAQSGAPATMIAGASDIAIR